MVDRVEATIRARVDDGTYRAGARLPGRRALASEHGTAEATVTAALHRLRAQGVLQVRPSAGWYVLAERPVIRSTRSRLSRAERAAGRGTFSTDCHAAGLEPDVSTVVEVVPADEDVAGWLGIDAGDEVLVRDRVMRAADEVVQLATSHLPRTITEGTAIELENPGAGGIYRRLEELGYELTSYIERVSIGRADEHEARIMQLGAGDPVFRVVRVAYAGDRAVEVNRITITGNRYELVYELPAE